MKLSKFPEIEMSAEKMEQQQEEKKMKIVMQIFFMGLVKRCSKSFFSMFEMDK